MGIFRDWRFIGTMIGTALLVSMVVRISADAISGHSDKIEKLEGSIAMLNLQLERLQTKQHPATARRFTADDADALMACLDQPNFEQRKCLKKLRLKYARKET